MVVDDEPMARSLIEDYISKVSSLELLYSFSDPIKALEKLQEEVIDILFLDIQMPEITGTSLLKLLKKRPKVILTTAYSEYAIEGFELEVTDYLLKPITFERFFKAIQKVPLLKKKDTSSLTHNASNHLNNKSEDPQQTFFFVKDGTTQIRINFEDIKYIKGLKDYVTIYTKNQTVTTLQNLKKLESTLPSSFFIRVHNSYIVSLSWITAIEKNTIYIGDQMIPISDSYRRSFRELVDKNLL